MPNDSNSETIMLFCAHPDDEAIGAGGTLAKYAKEGKEVIVVLYTDGESSHPWIKKTVLTRNRRKEAEKSGKVLGVHNIHHLQLHDGSLSKDIQKKEVHQKLVDLILEHQPKKIFTHSRDDALYPDHVAVHRSCLRAVDEVNKGLRKKIEVYTFNIWALHIRSRNDPKLFVDITDTFQIKKEALNCFKSQKLALFQLWPTIIYKAIVEGFSKETKYAEVFYRIR